MHTKPAVNRLAAKEILRHMLRLSGTLYENSPRVWPNNVCCLAMHPLHVQHVCVCMYHITSDWAVLMQIHEWFSCQRSHVTYIIAILQLFY